MRNLIYLFAVTLVFGLTSCEKEELEPETMPETLSVPDTTSTSSTTTDLHYFDGTGPALIDYTSHLYDIVNKSYYLYSENGVTNTGSARWIEFKTTSTSTGKYDIYDNYGSAAGAKWRTIDKAGKTFVYDWLGDDIYTYGKILTIDTYDSITGDVLITMKETSYSATDSLVLKLR